MDWRVAVPALASSLRLGMRPRCYNQPPPPEGSWMRSGRAPCGRERWRWVRHPFADFCASWAHGPGQQAPDPVRLGWDCRGCRLEPQTSASA